MADLPRVVPILIAYAVSCIVAGFILVLAVTLVSGSNGSGGPYDLGFFAVFASLAGFVAGIVALAVMLPALAAVVYAERNSVRSWAFYAVAGAAAGIVGVGLYFAALWLATGSSESIPDFDTGFVAAFAGFIALATAAGGMSGLTYWAIAGRNAGAP